MTAKDWLDLEVAFVAGSMMELERKRVEREKRTKQRKRAVQATKEAKR